MTTPIDADVLGRAGVAQSLIPRTLQSLETLDLINDKGEPTPTLEGLRRAPEGEYKQRLAEWLSGAYADVLNFIDPATASEIAVRDAFRSYNPVGQQPRMVTLFLGLYTAAGIRSADKPAAARAPRTTTPRPRATPLTAKQNLKNPLVRDQPAANGIPPALAGLLADLPPPGKGWPQARRDKFLTTFETVLDYCIPIVEEEEIEADAAA